MNYWAARQKEEEAEKAVLDKIEAARSTYDHDQSPYDWRAFIGEDSRQDDFACHRENMLDVLTDKDDGMLGMLYEIRDMLDPEMLTGPTEGSRSAPIATEGEPAAIKQEEPTSTSQDTTEGQFMRTWHHFEVSTRAHMSAINEDDASMLAMFREVGTATYTELSSGSRQLSDFVVANMKVALEFAQNMRKNVALLAAEVVSPQPSLALDRAAPAGDLSMVGMLRPEEWHCGYQQADLRRVRALKRSPGSLKPQS